MQLANIADLLHTLRHTPVLVIMRAILVNSTLGLDTSVTFVLTSATSANTFAHLHALSCDVGGGGHYNYNGGAVNAINENWPVASCDDDGMCTGHAMSDWQLTEADFAAGLSIVVHDTTNGNTKMLCADLTMASAGVYVGVFQTLPTYTLNWGALESGMASASKTVTVASVSFVGDYGDNTFGAHIHADTCANDGGGHFNGGDGVTADAVEEGWSVTTCVAGVCYGMSINDWIIPDSQFEAGLSIVIHNTPNTNEKMLCSDITMNDKRGVNKGSQLGFLSTFVGNFYSYPEYQGNSKCRLQQSTLLSLGTRKTV